MRIDKFDRFNNVLKNHGYNLKHNFGHGKNHAGEMYCLLNLLAFQMHSLLNINDEDYRKARTCAGRRDEFFNELRYVMKFKLFESWQEMWVNFKLLITLIFSLYIIFANTVVIMGVIEIIMLPVAAEIVTEPILNAIM